MRTLLLSLFALSLLGQNIRYNQIKPSDRQGTGTKFQMATSDTPALGDSVYYSANGDLIPTNREFNVKVFGAKGDGATNDTTAIQAAIDAAEAAGGGVVFFPTGDYFTSATILVTKPSVSLIGVPSAPNFWNFNHGSKIVCGLAVTPAVQFGDVTHSVFGNTMRDLHVSREDGTVPAGSIGILWAQFNHGRQYDVTTSRHDIGEQITNMEASVSAGFHSENYRSHDCLTAYLNLDGSTDSAWFGGSLGGHGTETVGPVEYGILFTGLAEQARFYNFTVIPTHATPGGSAIGFENHALVHGGFDFIHCNFERWNAGVTTDASTTELIDLHFTGGRLTLTSSAVPWLNLNAATRLKYFSVINASISGTMSMTNPYAATVVGNFMSSDGSTFDGTGADSSLVYSGNSVYETTTFTGPWKSLTVTSNNWIAGSPVTAGVTTETAGTNLTLFGNTSVTGVLDHEITGYGSGTREVYDTSAGAAFYPTLALGRLGNSMPLILKGGTVAGDLALGFGIRNSDGKSVIGAYVQQDTSDVTAGAEVADLVFFTKPAGSAATEKFRIGSAGQLGALLSGVPVYANNAAALAGGLTEGMFYRTNGDPDPLCIVH